MKKLLITLLLVFVLALSACSLTQYFPQANNSTAPLILNDSFLFSESVDEVQNTSSSDVVIVLDDEVGVETTASDEELPEVEETTDFADATVLTTVTVVEGETADLSFLAAQDPDGDAIRFTYSSPFTTAGTWRTVDGDEGSYLIQVTASDGVLSTTETVRVVVTPSNKGPVIDCPAEFTVSEGDTIDLPCTIFDREGDEVSFEVSGFMTGLERETDFEDAGTYLTTIVASDGNKETEKDVRIVVENVNRAPVVADVEQLVVTEGDFVMLDFAVNDPDGDAITIEYPILFDADGIWETSRGDAGTYELEATVSDGQAEVAVPVRILVEKVNLPPTMAELDAITVEEGETIVLAVDAQDPDGDSLSIEYSGFMTSRTYQTTFDDAGNYEVTITVSDGRHEVSQTVDITIENKNRPPVFIVR